MNHAKKYLVIGVASLLGLMLLSMLIVPWQLKRQAVSWVEKNTRRSLSLEKVFFNPFTLTVEIHQATLSEPDVTTAFVSFDTLIVSASSWSLMQLAVILDQVEIDALFVNLELNDRQEFNFADLLHLADTEPAAAVAQPAEPLHFSFNNIVLRGGGMDFSDQTSGKKIHHQVRELELSIPFIGNIPYLAEKYVRPQLHLLLNGAEVNAEGQLKPFADSLETSLSLMLDGVDLAFYAARLPFALPVEVRSGILDSQIDFAYRVSAQDHPRLLLGGDLALTDVDLREIGGGKLLRIPTLIVDLDWADLTKQDFNLRRLDIYQPQLWVDRAVEGRWNFQRLGDSAAQSSDQPPSAQATPDLPLIKAAKAKIHDAQLHFSDKFVGGGFNERVHQLNLELKDFSTLPQAETRVRFDFETEREFSAELRGQLGLNPPQARLKLLTNHLEFRPLFPYLQNFLNAPIEGRLNLATDLEYTPQGNLRLSHSQLALHQLKLPFGGEDQFALSSFMLTGGRFDLDQKRIDLGSITLKEGHFSATRLANGEFSPLALVRLSATDENPAPPPPPTAAAHPSDAWDVTMDKLALAQFQLRLRDAQGAAKPSLVFEQVQLTLENFSYPQSNQSPLSLSGHLGTRGTFAVNGSLAHSPLQLRADTQVKALPLAAFSDFLPAKMHLRLKDGQLHSKLELRLEQTPSQLTGSFAGGLNISRFDLRDTSSDDPLLAWESLGLDGIRGSLAPFALRVKNVALSNYLAQIQIDPQGKLNLNRFAADSEENLPAPEPVAATTNAETQSPPADIRIDKLSLQGGTFNFTDRHLPQIFATTLYDLGGRISGLSSQAEMQADVDLRGRLENHAPLTISGKLNPLSENLFADLQLVFTDIDLQPMTPYSGTYLGYTIARGKLNLNLNYHIEQQQVRADNQIMFDQLTLGESVNSEEATSLPVGLAISLLRDRQGEIHLDVPISGNLNDPSFSVAGTIFTLLKNLLVKAATSPFSLLASLLGGDQDFSSVSFPPGLAELEAPEEQKLVKLAAMLEQRPSLILGISAFVDRERDPEAYRRAQLNHLLQQQKRQQLAQQESTAAVNELLPISPDEYDGLLTEVYRQADFPRPRNFVGMLKELPPAEMEKLLLAHIIVGDEQLALLAKQRAFAVRQLLLEQKENIAAQIFLDKTDIDQPAASGPASRVEFTISSK